MQNVHPHQIVIDHATGTVTPIGEGNESDLLAAALIEQARAVRSAAIAVPADPETSHE